MIVDINHISGQSEWLRPHEPMILSHQEASLRPAHAWRSRDHFGTVSVRHCFSPVEAFPTMCASKPVACPALSYVTVICGARSAL